MAYGRRKKGQSMMNQTRQHTSVADTNSDVNVRFVVGTQAGSTCGTDGSMTYTVYEYGARHDVSNLKAEL